MESRLYKQSRVDIDNLASYTRLVSEQCLPDWKDIHPKERHENHENKEI